VPAREERRGWAQGLAATCAEAGVEDVDAATCAEAGVEDAGAASGAEVGVEDGDAVLDDGGGATPFMRSRISFLRRKFSSILDIEAQRSPISTMARFDLGGKIWVDSLAIWGKILGENWGILKNKALITNCHDPGLEDKDPARNRGRNRGGKQQEQEQERRTEGDSANGLLFLSCCSTVLRWPGLYSTRRRLHGWAYNSLAHTQTHTYSLLYYHR